MNRSINKIKYIVGREGEEGRQGRRRGREDCHLLGNAHIPHTLLPSEQNPVPAHCPWELSSQQVQVGMSLSGMLLQLQGPVRGEKGFSILWIFGGGKLWGVGTESYYVA